MSIQLQPYPVLARPRSALQWRLRRGYEEAERLAYEVSTLAVVHGAVCLGPDEAVRRFFDRVGLGPEAVAVVGFRVAVCSYTMAVPTFRSWNRHDLRRRIMSAVDEATSSGRSTMLVSPSEVTAQPRLGNVERMLRTMRPPAMGDADSLVAILKAGNREASLRQCETAIAGPFAAERVFGLMAGGLVDIDLSIALGADSRVRLRSSGRPFDWLEVDAWPSSGISPPLPRMEGRFTRGNDGRNELGIEARATSRRRPVHTEKEANHGP